MPALQTILRSSLWFFTIGFFRLVAPSHGSDLSEPLGMVAIELYAGSQEAPFYRIVSPGIKGESLYQGNVDSTTESNVSFARIPDLSNPAVQIGPLPFGVMNTSQARAQAYLDENGSIDRIELLASGSQYRGKPSVMVAPHTEGNGTLDQLQEAHAEAEWNSSTGMIDGIIVTQSGRGYLSPPVVTIDGGPYYLRIIDPESNFTGLYFRILSNSDDSVELENSDDLNFSQILAEGTKVEIFQGWTIASLFGRDDTQLGQDANSSLADWLYVIKDSSLQTGDSSDYEAIYNDGEEWKSVTPPNAILSDRLLPPDEGILVARRIDANLSLRLNGIASMDAGNWEIPAVGKRKLASNPYPARVMLSDLLGSESITEDNSSLSGHLWLAHPDQDFADNVQVIDASGWSTFWHDGSNLQVSRPASISARPGSGIGGALTVDDFSMKSGTIDALSNPSVGNSAVTSAAHGLKSGFIVEISGVTGRLTNENKEQIDASAEVVEDGEGLVVDSSANGKWEVLYVDENTFELIGCSGNSDFVFTENARWSTGDPGAGYDTDVTLSILGGKGTGALATGIVNNGMISSISLIKGGLLYLEAPEVIVHPGGWRRLGRGNAPINDLSVPGGAGMLLLRKHPHGTSARIPLRSIVED